LTTEVNALRFASEEVPKGVLVYVLLLPLLLLLARGVADLTVTLTGIAFLWHSYRNRDWFWLKQPWFVMVLVLEVCLLIFSVPLAFDVQNSLIYTLAFLRWPLFAMALMMWIFRNPKAIHWFGLSAMAVIAFIVFDCFWQFYFGADIFGFEKFDQFRLTGPLRDNPIPGNLTLRVFWLGLFTLACLLASRGPNAVINGVSLALLVYSLFAYATGERMSFVLSLAAAVILFFGLWFQCRQSRARILMWLLAITSSLALYTWLQPELYARSVSSMIDALSTFAQHDYGRVFSSGYQVWKQNIYTGVGLGNYAEYCDANLRVPEYNACQRHPHNIYLHWLAVGGILGAVLFCAVVVLLFRQIFTAIAGRKQWLLLACALATFFVTFWPLASSASFFNNWFGAVIWCSVGWLLAMSRSEILDQYGALAASLNRSSSRDDQVDVTAALAYRRV
jgi:O-antigen ligase